MKLPTKFCGVFAAALGISYLGCGPTPLDIEIVPLAKEQAERWAYNDRPQTFVSDLVYVLADLPSAGEAENVPWPGSYWPTYEDSINYRWDGEDTDSPAKKYEKAFGLSGVEDAVSRNHGRIRIQDRF